MKKYNENNNLEKELTMLQMMVRMRLLTLDQFKTKIKEIGEKYDLTIILRNHNVTTDTTTLEYV